MRKTKKEYNMRQTDKYYWAKRYATSEPEVVFFASNYFFYSGGSKTDYWTDDFYWVSDEPIPQPKIPLVLKDNHYYVIQPWGLCKMLGLHNQGRFDVIGGFWRESDVNVIAGPFTIEELVGFKPIN
jgi:hypothetical protein